MQLKNVFFQSKVMFAGLNDVNFNSFFLSVLGMNMIIMMFHPVLTRPFKIASCLHEKNFHQYVETKIWRFFLSFPFFIHSPILLSPVLLACVISYQTQRGFLLRNLLQFLLPFFPL